MKRQGIIGAALCVLLTGCPDATRVLVADAGPDAAPDGAPDDVVFDAGGDADATRIDAAEADGAVADVGNGLVPDGATPPDVGPDPDDGVEPDVSDGATPDVSRAPDAGDCGDRLERCNGRDDDCDGVTDEGFGVGDVCEGGGVCGRGFIECAGEDSVRCSTGPMGSEDNSGPEVCDGDDDDCDGEIDEAITTICYTGPQGTAGVGLCEVGRVACVDGGFEGACEGEIRPADDDQCDGQDQDCDGTIDEGFVVEVCGLGVCRANAVPSACEAGVGRACQPGGRTGDDSDCDELDDDCDGAVDEDFGRGVPGACGVGACRRNGIICVDGAPAPCMPGEPTGDDTDCDGVDDDCDGIVDEDYAVVQSCGEGVCGAASTPSSCELGIETVCAPGLATGDDADCDGVDQDCDGSVDEDYVVVAECGLGRCAENSTPSRCKDGVETACVEGIPGPNDIACDNEDADCDGAIDEDYQVVEACGTGLCRILSTASRCANGVERACEPGAPSPIDATCDGADDDCDGQVDEDYAVVGCGLGECRRQSACLDGAELACAPAVPAAEQDQRCDGLDEDCDGRVDEEYVVDECGFGVCIAQSACADGAETVCEPGPPQGPDADCDTIDNDCDGVVDEDAPVLDTGEVRLTEQADQSVRPAIATAANGYAVVWSDDRTGDGLIWFQRVGLDGSPIGEPTQITNVGPANVDVDIVSTGNDFGVVWTSSRDPIPGIYFRRVSRDGVPLGVDQRIDNRLGSAVDPAITWTGTEFGVTWMQGPQPNRDIWFRRISAAGALVGDPLQVNATVGTSIVPDIAWSGAQYGIAWTEVEDGNANIWFARVSGVGALVAPPVRTIGGDGSANSPSLVSTGAEFGLAWYDTRDDTQIFFARVDNSGRLRGEEVQVTTDRRISSLPELAWNGQFYGVAWQDTREGNFEIFFAQIAGNGDVGAPVRVSRSVGNSFLPRPAWRGDAFGVVWYDDRDGNNEIYFGRGPLGCEP